MQPQAAEVETQAGSPEWHNIDSTFAEGYNVYDDDADEDVDNEWYNASALLMTDAGDAVSKKAARQIWQRGKYFILRE
jgi:hypothetical protein